MRWGIGIVALFLVGCQHSDPVPVIVYDSERFAIVDDARQVMEDPIPLMGPTLWVRSTSTWGHSGLKKAGWTKEQIEKLKMRK